MRQGQQHRRGRGRNNNNGHQRKGQNPLTRSYESNGPDVKVRGTPSLIAEKYISLARDAQSSGDPVLAESYLQYAEHYNRIILTFREQQQAQQMSEFGGNPQRLRGEHADDDESGEDDGIEDLGSAEQPVVTGRFPNEPQRQDAQGGEPRQHSLREPGQGEHGPREHGQREHGQRHHRGDRNDRQRGDRFERYGRGDRDQRRGYDRHQGGDRGDRGDRSGGERIGGGERAMDMRSEPRMNERAPIEARESMRPAFVEEPPPPVVREEAEPRGEMPVRRSEGNGTSRRRERFGPDNEQPEFLRRPVRRPRRDSEAAATEASSAGDEPPRE